MGLLFLSPFSSNCRWFCPYACLCCFLICLISLISAVSPAYVRTDMFDCSKTSSSCMFIDWATVSFILQLVGLIIWRGVLYPHRWAFELKKRRALWKNLIWNSSDSLKKKIMHNIQQHVDDYISEQEKEGVCAVWKEFFFSTTMNYS